MSRGSELGLQRVADGASPSASALRALVLMDRPRVRRVPRERSRSRDDQRDDANHRMGDGRDEALLCRPRRSCDIVCDAPVSPDMYICHREGSEVP